MCAHPVLSGKAIENIENSVLTELVITDTIPLRRHSERIKVLSVAPLFARAIRNVHEYGSISSLFRIQQPVQGSFDLGADSKAE
jgi:ribose-phosphate pyrophosphokinase